MHWAARVTASEGARALGVSLHCLVMWRSAGLIAPLPGLRAGRWPEYRFGDLLAAEARTRRTQRGRPRRKVAA
jgi:hypothetical protein